ncbi:hypothetical protein [uncultured Methanobrevibacter sp.]|uniref:hypothetical protein n=1 Tax=uncultured Methanobrevibacter sp. TaxID=253161 RepID=UPI0025DEC1C0|nr:hypothetical protein [uncultured Methanobrevibacter sp.]
MSSVAEEHGKKAYPQLNRRNYDLDNGVKGISIYGETNIRKIAARNGVRPNKQDVLPYYGYQSCTEYVSKYANNPHDVSNFIEEWKKVSKEQERRASLQIQRSSQSSYNTTANQWKSADFNGKTITHEVVHWFNLTIPEHQARIDEIYENTVLKDLCVSRPVVRKHPSIYGHRTEYWRIRARKSDQQDDWSTNASWNALYRQCCKHCGYEM